MRHTDVRNCNQKATGFFALTVGVTSSGLEVPNKKNSITKKRALEVEEATWAEGAGRHHWSQKHVGPGLQGRAGGVRGGRGHRVGLR